MHSIRVHEVGGPEKLVVDELPEPKPGPGEVRVKLAATGINFVEIYHRTGLYPRPLPFTLGSEGAGTVTAVGPDSGGFCIGDRVASMRFDGAYAESALAPVEHVVRLPEAISFRQAAAVLLQGATAHALANDVYPLKPSDSALIHAAAGGVGLLLIQMAKRRGARVLAAVGSPEKSPLVKTAGADEVVVTSQSDFAEAARRFTAGRGVDVVYDSVGAATFDGSLASLRPRGMFVSYGNASGPVPPFAPIVLTQKGSLFFTRPSVSHYTATREELQMRADDLFRWVGSGALQVRIGANFPLLSAADAHRALAGRQTTGKILLEP